ncbi:hypothetical protein OSI08_05135 [Mycobacterium ulcerans]
MRRAFKVPAAEAGRAPVPDRDFSRPHGRPCAAVESWPPHAALASRRRHPRGTLVEARMPQRRPR